MINDKPETPSWFRVPDPPKLAAPPNLDLLEQIDHDLPPMLERFNQARTASLAANTALAGDEDFSRALAEDDTADAVTALAGSWARRLGVAWQARKDAVTAERAVIAHCRTVTYPNGRRALQDLETDLLGRLAKAGNFAQLDDAGKFVLADVRNTVATQWRSLVALLTWCTKPHTTPNTANAGWPGWLSDVERQVDHQPPPIPTTRLDLSLGIASRKRITATPTPPSGDRRNRRMGYP